MVDFRLQYWRSQQIILHKDSIHIHGLQKSNQQDRTNVLRLLQRIRIIYFQIWYYGIYLLISDINIILIQLVTKKFLTQCNVKWLTF